MLAYKSGMLSDFISICLVNEAQGKMAFCLHLSIYLFIYFFIAILCVCVFVCFVSFSYVMFVSSFLF